MVKKKSQVFDLQYFRHDFNKSYDAKTNNC